MRSPRIMHLALAAASLLALFPGAMADNTADTITSKLQENVTAHGKPEEINTDREFLAEPIQAYLRRNNIRHLTKDPKSYNEIATADRAIGQLKTCLNMK